MAKTIALSIAAAFMLSGCLVVRDRPTRVTRVHLDSDDHHHGKRECHPSQYWDGERCIHKGKGHGARKHDD